MCERFERTGNEIRPGPAAMTLAQSGAPQQCTPTSASCSTAASAPDNRSMAASGGSGNDGSIISGSAGSSSTTIWVHSGSAAAIRWCSACTCPRTARTATSNARWTGTPARMSVVPSVSGPTNCHLTGPVGRISDARSRNARNPENAAWSTFVSTSANGSTRRTSTARLPYCPSVTPRMPITACAIRPSAGERFGRLGIAGSVGNCSRTKRAADAASR